MRRFVALRASVAFAGALSIAGVASVYGQAPIGVFTPSSASAVAPRGAWQTSAYAGYEHVPAVPEPVPPGNPYPIAAPDAAAACQPSAEPCDYCLPAAACVPPPRWSLSAGALFMFQDNENHQTFSYDSLIESTQLLDYKGLDPNQLPGVQIGLSCFDCCCQTGWEVLYWGLFPNDSTAYAYNTDVTGDLNPILNFDQLDYNGASADNFTNDAAVHRLTRSSEIHNAELNRLWGVPTAPGSPWQFRTLAGFRYFRFEEGLEFASDPNDTAFTGEADELYYTIDTQNNLYGLQLGGVVQRQAWGRLGLTAGAKAGVFGNDASAHSRIGGAAGTATVNNGPNAGRVWDITAEKQDVAFLAELQAGLTYQIGARWRLLGQYRVVGVSGVALPSNQIYPDLRGIQDVQLLNTNGSLFLHGVFVGAERYF